MSPAWAERLRLAARLGVAPAAFWRLSVAEWRALTGPGPANQSIDRAGFDALARQFPDTEQD